MRTLYPFQTRARREVYAAIRAGRKAILLVSPAGSGKSTMASAIAADVVSRSKRVVWFAHRDELIEQGRQTLAEFGVRSGVTLMTYQTATARGEAPEADLAIFDEAHHLSEDNDWARVRQAYAGVTCLGLTATPERADGAALEGFDHLVTAALYSELLALNAEHPTKGIVPCRILRAPRTLKGKEILQRPVDSYISEAPGSIAVVFGGTVAACQTFVDDFRAAGVAAELVHAGLSREDRRAVLARWRAGTTRVVCNVGILTEGFDFPGIATVILARGCGSPGLYIQMTARGLRPAAGKREMLLLDLAGVSWQEGFGSPTADRVYSLDGAGIRLAGAEPAEPFCRTCAQPSSQCTCARDPETGLPIVVGGQLEPWREAMRAEPPSKQAQRLARWLREATAKSYKPGWALQKFKWAFGRFPDSNLMAQARELSRAAS